MTIDLTITHRHRLCMRRLAAGMSLGSVASCLADLYLAGLVDDLAMDGRAPEPRLTAEGRALLDAHTAATMLPPPSRWQLVDGTWMHDCGATFEVPDDEDLEEAWQVAHDRIELLRWLMLDAACRARGAS